QEVISAPPTAAQPEARMPARIGLPVATGAGAGGVASDVSAAVGDGSGGVTGSVVRRGSFGGGTVTSRFVLQRMMPWGSGAAERHMAALRRATTRPAPDTCAQPRPARTSARADAPAAPATAGRRASFVPADARRGVIRPTGGPRV